MRAVKIILITLLALGVAVGCWALFSLHNQLKELQQVQQGEIVPQPPAEPALDYVTIYLIKSEPTEFLLVPVQREIGGPASPTAALQALLNGPLTHEDLFASVPHTAKLLNLTVENGLATANFSREIVTGFNGGSLLESYLVTAIVNTLTEFDHIQQVQILVDGQVTESIGGHILVNQPLRRAAN
ncbi:MAG TPA: GerMN domain-containing protein [Firmicutes bacterium]|jgi:spore germination protein GerM|nr:GerMN domain-containing protein [Bacillota bacterium]HHT42319.1 GerMN domain-containing protein [Bacillota bacterium]